MTKQLRSWESRRASRGWRKAMTESQKEFEQRAAKEAAAAEQKAAHKAAAAKERLERDAEEAGFALVPFDEHLSDGEVEPHPLCALFPEMVGEEFDELVADIKRNGQREPGTVMGKQILDARNRRRACRVAGVPFRVRQYTGTDPVGLVISANIRRRHLSSEQKRQLIAALLHDNPNRSDRAIARDIGVSKNTVAAERAVQESRGQLDHVETRTDTKGR